MLRKVYLIIPIILMLAVAAFAQETENAAASSLTGAALPAGALRVLPNSVPAEINNGLDKLVEAGQGKLAPGEREVLAWSGGNYRKANAPTILGQIQRNLKAQGWTYEQGGTEEGVTVFSVSRTTPARRAILGYFVATDEALVVAWMEVLKNDGTADTETTTGTTTNTVDEPVRQTSNGSMRDLLGSWYNGSVGLVTRQNTVTGMTTPGRSSRFEYKFTADGRFLFTGLMQLTNYSCTDTYYNERSGRFTLDGSTLTLAATKDYWKKTNTCSASGNMEKTQPGKTETYQLSTKTDDYGKPMICLTGADGGEPACYVRTGK
ncbi:MAG: hypothetical protein JSS81_27120 [Acidobacteria bacterium]|nr:hypothetical protein [Acidobacteriota bacterium]